MAMNGLSFLLWMECWLKMEIELFIEKEKMMFL